MRISDWSSDVCSSDLSSSPRRRDLLARLGIVPDAIVAPDIDESPLAGELPRAYPLRLARAKAEAVARAPGDVILAGDTTVALRPPILQPAADQTTQRRLLGLLSARLHHSLSALCLLHAGGAPPTLLVHPLPDSRAPCMRTV